MSLLIPGAGFIKAIMAIKDLIVFFVESAIMLIPAITEAILALAAGSVVGVAKAIEFGLSKLIALVINLFAKLIGLGGLSKKVMAIFSKIRKRVDKAVMKLLNKAKKAGRKLMRKLGIGKKKDKNGAKEKRSKKEMEADLKSAIAEGKFILGNEKSIDIVNKKLKKLKNKYDLKELNLKEKNKNDKEIVYYIHGEVNPKLDSDPIRKYIGSAKDSHPEEYERTMKYLKSEGVEIRFRHGAMAYSPSPSAGKPGQLIFDPEASISALRHELQHYEDDKSDGFPGMRALMQNPDKQYELEIRAYDKEIKFAQEQGKDDVVEDLIKLRENERKKIYGEEDI